LAAEFEQLTARDKIIVTTEKDAQRLRSPELAAMLANLPIYVVPVAADFEEPDKEDFDHLLKQHAREHTYNH
jgi:tetraacyldisaccharide 4'-kinase